MIRIQALFMKALLVIVLLWSFGCSPKPKTPAKIDSAPVEKTHLLSDVICEQERLSNQFDLTIEAKHYDGITSPIDSCTLKVVIRRKSSGFIMDSIVLFNVPNFRDVFKDCNSMKSFTTGFNSSMQIVDNYFGDMVIADLNFDTLDDIAIIDDTGGNGGSEYLYYTQTQDKKFKLDKFLTDSMTYFPQKIDNKKHSLTTFVHAGACCLGKHVYHLNADTTWHQISHKILGLEKYLKHEKIKAAK